MTMSLRTSLYCLICLLTALHAGAQPNATAELRPHLRALTTEQKLRLLEYMRSLGADLDKEVQFTYEQLSQSNRSKAFFYVNTLQDDPSNRPRTTVMWTPDTIRYGFIEEGTIVLDSFTVTNTGPNPYLVRDVRASCDCTVLQKPDYPLMPGESLTLRVEFNSAGKRGRTQPGIVVYDNSSPNLRNILYLDGEILPREKGMKKDR
jgi:hypothetical protein